jgi:hypothetical protein
MLKKAYIRLARLLDSANRRPPAALDEQTSLHSLMKQSAREPRKSDAA